MPQSHHFSYFHCIFRCSAPISEPQDFFCLNPTWDTTDNPLKTISISKKPSRIRIARSKIEYWFFFIRFLTSINWKSFGKVTPRGCKNAWKCYKLTETSHLMIHRAFTCICVTSRFVDFLLGCLYEPQSGGEAKYLEDATKLVMRTAGNGMPLSGIARRMHCSRRGTYLDTSVSNLCHLKAKVSTRLESHLSFVADHSACLQMEIHTYITLHYITLRYVTLRYITLHYITLLTLHTYIHTWHDMTWHDITSHHITRHGMAWHEMTWHDMTWNEIHTYMHACTHTLHTYVRT